MKKINKTIAVALGLAMCSTCVPLANVSAIDIQPPNSEITLPALKQDFMGKFVSVKGINGNQITASYEDTKTKTSSDIIFNISDETYFISNKTGLAISSQNLKSDDVIFVYHSMAETYSIPPQTFAFVVLTDVAKDKGVATLFDVEKTTFDNNTLSTYSKDGQFVISFTDKTEVSSYLTKNIVKYSDVKENDKVLAWFNIIETSYPAKATADKAVILDNQQVDKTENITVCEFVRFIVNEISGELPRIMDAHYALPYMKKATELGLIDKSVYENQNSWNEKISTSEINKIIENAKKTGFTITDDDLDKIIVSNILIDGKPIKSSPSAVLNGNIMIPLRDVAEQLGFTVSWDEKTNSCEINNGEVKSTIALGFDSYFKASAKAIGLTAPQNFGTAPTLINDKTYVPCELFELIYSNPEAVVIQNGSVNIIKPIN